jgi:pimeloyl-ACP methyl ester carboxylesterase
MLAVPGAHLYYERRGAGPLVVLVGAPMDAGAFVALAERLAVDHTVVTTDPRGINRSSVDDPEADSTPELRADDLAHLITHHDVGPAVVLGSSGGAVSALALAQRHPELVRTVIPHEPPLHRVLPNATELLAETEAMIAMFRTGDRVQAQRMFVTLADLDMPEEVFQMIFGAEPEPQPAADERFQFLHMLLPTCRWMPDIAALTAAPVRVVLGVGESSAGQFCDRSTRALAAMLGAEIELFPGGHVGFIEDPATFADRLRAIIG